MERQPGRKSGQYYNIKNRHLHRRQVTARAVNSRISSSLQPSFHPFTRIIGESLWQGFRQFFAVFAGCAMEKIKLMTISPAPLAIEQMEP
jgi:hypothetical protein